MASQRTSVGAFDVRFFIAVALGVIGVFLLVVAAVDTTPAELEKTGGLRANLWTGVALVVAAAGFALWARLRPLTRTTIAETAEVGAAITTPADEPGGPPSSGPGAAAPDGPGRPPDEPGGRPPGRDG